MKTAPNPMTRSVRMSDVAKLAQVSTMTVSRVLNDNPKVTEETRMRVSAAIEQLKYHRNELARSLRAQRSRQIGILVPNLYDPFFANCAHAVSLVAKQHSYSVVLSTSDEDPKAEFDEASRMLHRNIDGLVVIPTPPLKGTSRLLGPEFQNLPIVTMDRPLIGSHIDTVMVDNKRGARMGVEHLIALGHKRIAFFGLTRNVFTTHARQQGYLDAMRAAGLKAEVVLVSEVAQEAMVPLHNRLAGKQPPTALFCANNLTTRHVLHGLQELDMHPPKPIALVGFDDFETADLLRVTVVRQPVESLGRLAAETLLARLERGHRGSTQKIVLAVELIVRSSCGALG